MNRRRLLGGLGALSINTMLGSSRAAGKSSNLGGPIQHLNVVVHGLSAWVIERDSSLASKGIRLVFPTVVDNSDSRRSHRYWFGNLQMIQGHRLDLMEAVGPGEVLTLSGVTPGSRPAKAVFSADIVFGSRTVNSFGLRQFVLPWTPNIQSKRKTSRSDGKALFNDTGGFGLGTIKEIATIHVLTYDLADTDAPIITYADNTEAPWQPVASSNPAYATMHIFAEPKQSDADHALDSFGLLEDELNIRRKDLTFQLDTMSVANDNPMPGIYPAFDLQPLSKLFKAGETANCVSGIVYP